MIARVCSKGNTHLLLVGEHTSTGIMEIVFGKLGIDQPLDPDIIENIPKGCFIPLHRHLFNHAHSCTIYNTQILETT